MPSRLEQILTNIVAAGIIVGAFVVLIHPEWVGFEQSTGGQISTTSLNTVAEPSAQSATSSPVSTSSPRVAPKSAPRRNEMASSSPVAVPRRTSQPASAFVPEISTTSDSFQVTRISDPYTFPPQSFTAINESARSALVNILCGARNGTYNPISASGVIIDPRGIILTNAHVAQYILLSGDPTVDLACVVRTGSPAYPRWYVEVLFIPPSWVKEHAKDITEKRPLGTGEHDYALLRVTSTINDQPLGALPFVPIDTREGITFTDDDILAASYPAEFTGGIVTQLNLYPSSSVTSVKKMMTLGGNFVDVISLGGIIGAQSGSSGGAVLNAWGRLVAVISTTSAGTTTADRDLHAITLSYIDRDISSESGLNLSDILNSNIASQSYMFNATIAPSLRQIIIDQIEATNN